MKSCVLSTQRRQVLLGISDVAVQSGKTRHILDTKQTRGVAEDGREEEWMDGREFGGRE